MKRIIVISLTLIVALGAKAQDEKKFGVKFSGFVKNDFFWDSRQTIAAREGHFLLWPAGELLDANGEDINAVSNFNFLAIQSRLGAAISGPDVLGAKVSALIEADFFAQSNININLLRLRHAYIKLNWTHLELLTGQTWNPLFVTGCFPGTVSFNTGTPLQSFARNPQVRVTYKAGNFSIIAAALGQRDFATVGPLGSTSRYLRNSSIPDMHLQVHYGTKNEEGANLLTGLGMAYKTIVPRTMSTPTDGVSYKVKEKVQGLTAIAFAKVTTKPVTIKLQGRYGENISDLLAISGFAVRNILDATTGEQEYTPLKSTTFWAEVHSNGNPQVGLFGGITSNNGTKHEMFNAGAPVYGRANSIRTLYRISPRIHYNIEKFRVGFELEYTHAAYGSDYDTFYIPSTIAEVANLRGLLAVYYFF